jgi:hypothetical protein
MLDLPNQLATSIKMPNGAAIRLADAAEREWGVGSVLEVAPGVTRVLYWLGGRRQFAGQSSVQPAGGFLIRWQHPTPALATIERLGWDLAAGGSELEVREVIDVLAGWPVATPRRARSGAA